jgi:hypothetical protein
MRGPELQDVTTVFDFVFVVSCVAGLLGLLAKAALHEDDGRQPIRVSSNGPQP